MTDPSPRVTPIPSSPSPHSPSDDTPLNLLPDEDAPVDCESGPDAHAEILPSPLSPSSTSSSDDALYHDALPELSDSLSFPFPKSDTPSPFEESEFDITTTSRFGFMRKHHFPFPSGFDEDNYYHGSESDSGGTSSSDIDSSSSGSDSEGEDLFGDDDGEVEVEDFDVLPEIDPRVDHRGRGRRREFREGDIDIALEDMLKDLDSHRGDYGGYDDDFQFSRRHRRDPPPPPPLGRPPPFGVPELDSPILRIRVPGELDGIEENLSDFEHVILAGLNSVQEADPSVIAASLDSASNETLPETEPEPEPETVPVCDLSSAVSDVNRYFTAVWSACFYTELNSRNCDSDVVNSFSRRRPGLIQQDSDPRFFELSSYSEGADASDVTESDLRRLCEIRKRFVVAGECVSGVLERVEKFWESGCSALLRSHQLVRKMLGYIRIVLKRDLEIVAEWGRTCLNICERLEIAVRKSQKQPEDDDEDECDEIDDRASAGSDQSILHSSVDDFDECSRIVERIGLMIAKKLKNQTGNMGEDFLGDIVVSSSSSTSMKVHDGIDHLKSFLEREKEAQESHWQSKPSDPYAARHMEMKIRKSMVKNSMWCRFILAYYCGWLVFEQVSWLHSDGMDELFKRMKETIGAMTQFRMVYGSFPPTKLFEGGFVWDEKDECRCWFVASKNLGFDEVVDRRMIGSRARPPGRKMRKSKRRRGRAQRPRGSSVAAAAAGRRSESTKSRKLARSDDLKRVKKRKLARARARRRNEKKKAEELRERHKVADISIPTIGDPDPSPVSEEIEREPELVGECLENVCVRLQFAIHKPNDGIVRLLECANRECVLQTHRGEEPHCIHRSCWDKWVRKCTRRQSAVICPLCSNDNRLLRIEVTEKGWDTTPVPKPVSVPRRTAAAKTREDRIPKSKSQSNLGRKGRKRQRREQKQLARERREEALQKKRAADEKERLARENSRQRKAPVRSKTVDWREHAAKFEMKTPSFSSLKGIIVSISEESKSGEILSDIGQLRFSFTQSQGGMFGIDDVVSFQCGQDHGGQFVATNVVVTEAAERDAVPDVAVPVSSVEEVNFGDDSSRSKDLSEEGRVLESKGKSVDDDDDEVEVEVEDKGEGEGEAGTDDGSGDDDGFSLPILSDEDDGDGEMSLPVVVVDDLPKIEEMGVEEEREMHLPVTVVDSENDDDDGDEVAENVEMPLLVVAPAIENEDEGEDPEEFLLPVVHPAVTGKGFPESSVAEVDVSRELPAAAEDVSLSDDGAWEIPALRDDWDSVPRFVPSMSQGTRRKKYEKFPFRVVVGAVDDPSLPIHGHDGHGSVSLLGVPSTEKSSYSTQSRPPPPPPVGPVGPIQILQHPPRKPKPVRKDTQSNGYKLEISYDDGWRPGSGDVEVPAASRSRMEVKPKPVAVAVAVDDGVSPDARPARQRRRNRSNRPKKKKPGQGQEERSVRDSAEVRSSQKQENQAAAAAPAPAPPERQNRKRGRRRGKGSGGRDIGAGGVKPSQQRGGRKNPQQRQKQRGGRSGKAEAKDSQPGPGPKRERGGKNHRDRGRGRRGGKEPQHRDSSGSGDGRKEPQARGRGKDPPQLQRGGKDPPQQRENGRGRGRGSGRKAKRGRRNRNKRQGRVPKGDFDSQQTSRVLQSLEYQENVNRRENAVHPNPPSPFQPPAASAPARTAPRLDADSLMSLSSLTERSESRRGGWKETLPVVDDVWFPKPQSFSDDNSFSFSGSSNDRFAQFGSPRDVRDDLARSPRPVVDPPFEPGGVTDLPDLSHSQAAQDPASTTADAVDAPWTPPASPRTPSPPWTPPKTSLPNRVPAASLPLTSVDFILDRTRRKAVSTPCNVVELLAFCDGVSERKKRRRDSRLYFGVVASVWKISFLSYVGYVSVNSASSVDVPNIEDEFDIQNLAPSQLKCYRRRCYFPCVLPGSLEKNDVVLFRMTSFSVEEVLRMPKMAMSFFYADKDPTTFGPLFVAEYSRTVFRAERSRLLPRDEEPEREEEILWCDPELSFLTEPSKKRIFAKMNAEAVKTKQE